MGLQLARALPSGLRVLGVNSVPVAGFLLADWSILTALAIYWSENVLGSLLLGVRLVLHRRWTRKRGYWEARVGGSRGSAASPQSGFIGGFLSTALLFCLAHGVFLAVLALVLPSEYQEIGVIEPGQLLAGVALVLLFLLGGFSIDLSSLRRWSFAEIQGVTERMLGRVVVVHLTILIGMLALGVTGRASALFTVFAGFKALVDLSTLLPRAQPAAAPPGWLVWLMGRLRSDRGEEFATFWRRSRERELQQVARNEEPV